jgi:alanyl-tRNA synthetase
MTVKELKTKFRKFFKEKNHAVIPSSPIIPEHDPTVLFTTAGMHSLTSYLMGQIHPLGKRLAGVQKCIRTQDVDEVGNSTHITFFEMLGNWSLGDYFKKEAIEWSFEFLTSKKWLGLDVKRFAVTCFAGDSDASKDLEAAKIWKSLGIPKERIAFLPKKDNWWGPVGLVGPCGPDTEMFYWKSDDHPPKKFDPNNKNWVEIWNNVFMQYNKEGEGKYVPLAQKNVDTGLGAERVAMILQGKEDIFQIDVFKPIVDKISELAKKNIIDSNQKSFKIIADHIKAATFILGDEQGVAPSNLDQGYILRRYIRRAMRHLRLLGIDLKHSDALVELAKIVVDMYSEDYSILAQKREFIFDELKKEQDKFLSTLDRGLKEFEKVVIDKKIDAKSAFLLYQSCGFPIEMIEELARERDARVDLKGFCGEFEKHQALSRRGAEKKFKGGLGVFTKETIRFHTVTHLLHQALRDVLGSHVRQAGSNITTERLRFDFTHPKKLTKEQIKKVEEIVNLKIHEALPINFQEMKLSEAQKQKALAFFCERYPEKVKVYSIGNYSKEICGGPHLKNTKELGRFKIIKEEASSAGVRRIKAILE